MFNHIAKVVPNLFTIGNLLCGVLSITFNMSSFYQTASILIFISAILDLFDGRIARKLKVNSEFGVELDSLADIVSFGVAPALLFHSLAQPSVLASLAFFLFPTMGALRLAKFSVKPTIGYFRGLPIPAAGLPLAGMGLFLYSNVWITLILALLMVSPIRVKKF
ncbi:CDP-diacylglycerol--serine O-phosphatidyltransferase [Lederbergia wuyishanensis]|uniref:CDP-diacylglycerol--serine O-phosphatidyltransferase n=1 Tax=Lederbergia wuyishanensis TaxID=1347903 RepID=A0ABU0D687_9BACI|nr:CDP-diacylglycerol--serine O-phosphatidyltransferase [Lederbergia wuyishanensis]MCJ8008655.1 CDP-diacylglycerol--serine O-phosphatidyltransferase [Lederbergia wuyishanensis]MDQ0343927.1 CDP-diacylglycerol--serine O-phosphatidyltransferase [Lederbergia wuyishanensis]